MKFHCAPISCPGLPTIGASLATFVSSKGDIVTDELPSLNFEVTIEDAPDAMLRTSNRALKLFSKDMTTPKNGRHGSSSKKRPNHSQGPTYPHSNDLVSKMTDVDGNSMCIG